MIHNDDDSWWLFKSASTLSIHLPGGETFLLKHTWLKIQRRGMGTRYTEGMFGNGKSLWTDFKNGFGTPSSDEFWLGLDAVHNLTRTGRWELMFKAKWQTGKWAFAIYSDFMVDDEISEYKIHFGRKRSSHEFGSDDPFKNHNGAIFRTSDRNAQGCTSNGAWWHFGADSTCYHACFNCAYSNGNVWFDGSRGRWLAADVTEMLIRRSELTSELTSEVTSFWG